MTFAAVPACSAPKTIRMSPAPSTRRSVPPTARRAGRGDGNQIHGEMQPGGMSPRPLQADLHHVAGGGDRADPEAELAAIRVVVYVPILLAQLVLLQLGLRVGAITSACDVVEIRLPGAWGTSPGRMAPWIWSPWPGELAAELPAAAGAARRRCR